MTRLLARLVLLVAIVLMPLGMAGPGNAAANHAPTMAKAVHHCPDENSRNDAGFARCAMACSAALPALAPTAAQAMPIAPEERVPTLASRLDGIAPEIATPPPRTA